jgi:hypothetical protein
MVKDKQRGTVSKGEARGYPRPGAGNMNYVRTLLKANHPQFAALLERLERELSTEAEAMAEVPASRNAADAVSVAA